MFNKKRKNAIKELEKEYSEKLGYLIFVTDVYYLTQIDTDLLFDEIKEARFLLPKLDDKTLSQSEYFIVTSRLNELSKRLNLMTLDNKEEEVKMLMEFNSKYEEILMEHTSPLVSLLTRKCKER